VILAHVGGVPVEETLAMGGPALLTFAGLLAARVSSRVRRALGRGRRAPVRDGGARGVRGT
jgi:hypothetical protein